MSAKIILFIVLFLISLYTVCAYDPYCMSPCIASPSLQCVTDRDTAVVLQKCAVGCYETSGPFGGAFCSYGDFLCAFYPGLGDYSCWDGSTPTVSCSIALLVNNIDASDCITECAAACGRRTKLTADCKNCTSSDMCSIYPAGSVSEIACNNTCVGVCGANEQFCGIIELLRFGAMFLGIIMLILHGLRWLISEDLEWRNEAKKGIIFVLLGLSLIVVASVLVQLIFYDTIIC